MMGALSLVTMGLLAACDRNSREGGSYQAPGASSSKGTTNMQPTVDSATVGRIATSRCDREQMCNNIGGGKAYVTRSACMDQMQGNIANELNSYNCPSGLDAQHVDECLAAISGEKCDHPLDTLSRVDKCRTGALCAR
jgi:hypothetical protein